MYIASPCFCMFIIRGFPLNKTQKPKWYEKIYENILLREWKRITAFNFDSNTFWTCYWFFANICHTTFEKMQWILIFRLVYIRFFVFSSAPSINRNRWKRNMTQHQQKHMTRAQANRFFFHSEIILLKRTVIVDIYSFIEKHEFMTSKMKKLLQTWRDTYYYVLFSYSAS